MIHFDKSRVRILVVDDEESLRTIIAMTLKDDGWYVEMAENGRHAMEILEKAPFHIVMSDIQMPEMTGIQLLEAVKQKSPLTEFIIMTSNATLETAVQALKLGAYDYLTKPFEDIALIPKKMNQVSEKILLRQQNTELLKRLKKASLDLKLLFEFTSHLNGILEEASLVDQAIQGISKVLQESQVYSAWFVQKPEGWALVKQSEFSPIYQEGEFFQSIDDLRAKASGLRSLFQVVLKFEGEADRLFLFEGIQQDLANLFAHELKICFEKVMRHQEVLSLANRDGLTRLYNHRYFQDRLKQEMSQVKRQNGDLSLILLDVDHFKNYNDTHGHPMGDQLLRELAQLLDKESTRRNSDIVARYGGEEFVFILPFTDYAGALIKAEKIRSLVESHPFPNGDQQPLGKVTVSVGVATFPLHAVSAGALIELADKGLYQAKAQGRNAVVGYEALKTAHQKGDDAEPKPTLGAVLSEFESRVQAAKAKGEDLPPIEVEIPAPVVEAPAPAPTPVMEVPAPVVEAPAPVVEAPAPVVEAPAPVVEAPAPVVEISAPVVEATAPAVEVPAPAPAPVVEISAPVVEATAPVVEAPVPAVEAPAPTPAPAVEVPAPAPTPVVEAPVPAAVTEINKTQNPNENEVSATAIEAVLQASLQEPAGPGEKVSRPSIKRKALGPEIDVDDLMHSIESVYESNAGSLVKPLKQDETTQDPSFAEGEDKRGTGSER